METRLLYNRAIVDKLKELVENNPELRFGQILWDCGILESIKDKQTRDPYFDEPKDIWNKMCNNKFCFPK